MIGNTVTKEVVDDGFYEEAVKLGVTEAVNAAEILGGIAKVRGVVRVVGKLMAGMTGMEMTEAEMKEGVVAEKLGWDTEQHIARVGVGVGLTELLSNVLAEKAREKVDVEVEAGMEGSAGNWCWRNCSVR